uniref:FAD-binding domain-containing protein n=1 Tax=Vitrella brassicaformis TaxID=1169539 RepID=A0A6U4C2G1_9ALVE
MPRTLEIYEDLGIVKQALSNGVEMLGERLFVDGTVAVDWNFSEVDSFYCKPLLLHQGVTEKLLCEKLAAILGPDRMNYALQRPVEVTSLKVGHTFAEGVHVCACSLSDPEESNANAEGQHSEDTGSVDNVTPRTSEAETTSSMTYGWTTSGDTGQQGPRTHRIRGKQFNVHARYVVGCDGARSFVRKSLGIPFEGFTIPSEFIVADVVMTWGVPPDRNKFNLLTAPNRMVECCPLPSGPSLLEPPPRLPDGGATHRRQGGGAARQYGSSSSNRWRLTTIRRIAEDRPEAMLECREARPPPSKKELQAMTAKLVAGTIIDHVIWSSSFSINCRSAAFMKRGNAFLAGDAAHIFPPLFHQGHNTGIGDAYNLGWKLAHVLQDGANPALLESYEQERKPVGDAVVRFTSFGYQEIIEAKGYIAWSMKNILPLFFNNKAFNSALTNRISQCHIKYPVDSGAVGKVFVSDSALPGERAPDATVAIISSEPSTVGNFIRLHEVYVGSGHVLLFVLRIPLSSEGPSGSSWFNLCSSQSQTAERNIIGKELEQIVEFASRVRSRIEKTKVVLLFTVGLASIVPPNAQFSGLSFLIANFKERMSKNFPNQAPEETCVAWDVEGEVTRRYRLHLHPFTKHKCAAFFLIRDDKHIRNHGYCGDTYAEATCIDSLSLYHP